MTDLPPMTDDELRAYSTDHLFYELEMVFWLGPLALKYKDPETLDDQIIKNALLESFTIHARCLKAFFYDKRARGDDVIADDYVSDPDEWHRVRGDVPEVLEKAVYRTHGEIAHLTRRRCADPEKGSGHRRRSPRPSCSRFSDSSRRRPRHGSTGGFAKWRLISRRGPQARRPEPAEEGRSYGTEQTR